MRRGASSDLDTSRLVSGEIAVASNPDKVVAKTPSGNVLTFATKEDIEDVKLSYSYSNGRLIFNNIEESS